MALENKYSKLKMALMIIVDNGNILVGNIFGRKYRVDDSDGKVGIYQILEHRTHILGVDQY